MIKKTGPKARFFYVCCKPARLYYADTEALWKALCHFRSILWRWLGRCAGSPGSQISQRAGRSMAIKGFHAHVYYDADTFSQAAALCQSARQKFDLTMGQMHRKRVGPHPRWSCQLTIPRRLAGEVIPW